MSDMDTDENETDKKTKKKKHLNTIPQVKSSGAKTFFPKEKQPL